MLKYKISKKPPKFFACGGFIFNIHIFRFKTGARVQVDIDFDTESKFSRSIFFSPLVDTKNQPKPQNFFLFYPLGGFRGPSKPFSQQSQSILCECKQTWKLLVKVKSDSFVKKQPRVQHEGGF